MTTVLLSTEAALQADSGTPRFLITHTTDALFASRQHQADLYKVNQFLSTSGSLNLSHAENHVEHHRVGLRSTLSYMPTFLHLFTYSTAALRHITSGPCGSSI